MIRPRVLATGFAFCESARWHDHRFWFSDWGTGEILAVDSEGQTEAMFRFSSVPLCFDWLPDGRLLVVAGTEILVARGSDKRSFELFADLKGLSRHAWNEITVIGGNVYVNCIDFSFPGGNFKPGIVALATSDGRVVQVADGLEFPNGMAITPDGSTLIVAESFGQRLTAFAIAEDGSLSGRRVWADIDGHVDGISLDAEGAVWCGVGKRCLRVREDGVILSTIELDRSCFSCVLAGKDGNTLCMATAEWRGSVPSADDERTGQVLTARTAVPGIFQR